MKAPQPLPSGPVGPGPSSAVTSGGTRPGLVSTPASIAPMVPTQSLGFSVSSLPQDVSGLPPASSAVSGPAVTQPVMQPIIRRAHPCLHCSFCLCKLVVYCHILFYAGPPSCTPCGSDWYRCSTHGGKWFVSWIPSATGHASKHSLHTCNTIVCLSFIISAKVYQPASCLLLVCR